MSGQEQINQSTDQEIQNLETIIQQLESEMINVETTIECQTLKRVTINFLQILKTLRENHRPAFFPENSNLLLTNAETIHVDSKI